MDKKQMQLERVEKYQKLISLLNENTFFMLSEHIEFKSVKHNHRMSADEISRLFIDNKLSNSEVFILQAVHTLGFATPEMVMMKLHLMKKRYPERVIPAVEIDAVRNRIIVLCESGLLVGQKIVNSNRKVGILYCCTEYAYTVMRKRLNQVIYGDNFLAVESHLEILRRAAANYVLLSLAEKVPCDYIHGYRKERTFFDKGVRASIYARMRITRNEKKLYLIALPLYFSVDKLVDDEGIIYGNYQKELRWLEKWIGLMQVQKERNTILIVCVENLQGLKRAASLIHQVTPELANKVLYTSERAIKSCQSYENEAFMEVKIYEDGKIQGDYRDIEELISEYIGKSV